MNQERECFVITGSSGLLGHALSHHFGSKDNQVIGFDEEGPPYPPPNTDCLFCDLTSDESVQKTFFMVRNLYGAKIKSVFHLAAYYSFSGKESHLYKDLTVDGTKRMLRELQKFDVGQFIFSSSMLVYKPNAKGELLTEESELEPTWAYPKSKVETEQLIKEQHKKVPTVILRIAGVYSDICQSIPLAHQIQRIYERRLEGHMYSGDVDVKQSYVHLDDVVSAFDVCVKNADKLSDFEIFNIGEENAISYDDTQRVIARVLFDEAWPTFDVPKPIAKAGAWVEEKLPLPEKPFIKPWMIDRADDNYEVDIQKARTILGWEPKHSLRDTLPTMLEGLKVDPQRWYKVNKLHGPEKQHVHSEVSEIPQEHAEKHSDTAPEKSTGRQEPILLPDSSAQKPSSQESATEEPMPLLPPPINEPNRIDKAV